VLEIASTPARELVRKRRLGPGQALESGVKPRCRDRMWSRAARLRSLRCGCRARPRSPPGVVALGGATASSPGSARLSRARSIAPGVVGKGGSERGRWSRTSRLQRRSTEIAPMTSRHHSGRTPDRIWWIRMLRPSRKRSRLGVVGQDRHLLAVTAVEDGPEIALVPARLRPGPEEPSRGNIVVEQNDEGAVDRRCSKTTSMPLSGPAAGLGLDRSWRPERRLVHRSRSPAAAGAAARLGGPNWR